MGDLVGREYCLKHPGQVVQTFGFGTLLGMVVGQRASLLERVTKDYEAHGFALPGTVGRAYRLAAVIERRVARIYGRLAERFAALPPVREFYLELQREEEEHGRLMELCRYTVSLKRPISFVPSTRDPVVRQIR